MIAGKAHKKVPVQGKLNFIQAIQRERNRLGHGLEGRATYNS